MCLPGWSPYASALEFVLFSFLSKVKWKFWVNKTGKYIVQIHQPIGYDCEIFWSMGLPIFSMIRRKQLCSLNILLCWCWSIEGAAAWKFIMALLMPCLRGLWKATLGKEGLCSQLRVQMNLAPGKHQHNCILPVPLLSLKCIQNRRGAKAYTHSCVVKSLWEKLPC